MKSDDHLADRSGKKFGRWCAFSSGNFSGDVRLHGVWLLRFLQSEEPSFPSGNPFLSLMLSLMTFGAGFLMRPLGAIVLGAYTDRHGRRAGLILTLALMSVGIFFHRLHARLRHHRLTGPNLCPGWQADPRLLPPEWN